MTWPFENDTHKIEKKLAKKKFSSKSHKKHYCYYFNYFNYNSFHGAVYFTKGINREYRTGRHDFIWRGWSCQNH